MGFSFFLYLTIIIIDVYLLIYLSVCNALPFMGLPRAGYSFPAGASSSLPGSRTLLLPRVPPSLVTGLLPSPAVSSPEVYPHHSLPYFSGFQAGRSPVVHLPVGVLAVFGFINSFAVSPSSTRVDLRLYDIRHHGLPPRIGSTPRKYAY